MIKQYEKGLIEPGILKSRGKYAVINIFLCGPGVEHKNFPLRNKIKEYLETYLLVSVHYGEDIKDKKFRKRISKTEADLQTLESVFAHQNDFTVLMLDSPGAIAELGAFSMTPSIRPRLYTLVSEQYYNNESYISRGPLSLLAKNHASNVIYYRDLNFREIANRLDWMLTFYKYAKSINYFEYKTKSLDPNNRHEYAEYIKKFYWEFISHSVLVAIICLDRPYFSEIVNLLRLNPDEVSMGLKLLYDRDAIEKHANIYIAKKGYEDEALSLFDTGVISKKKAILAAMNKAA